MSRKSDVCILILTCDRYLPVAEWTKHRIATDWADHPPLFVHGSGDDRDWMTVALDGVSARLSEGFRWIYLVLDDHPPVGKCNARAMNTTLPELARRLDAVNICLLGWGQRREREGEVLSSRDGALRRNDTSFRWKFSLHPALWNAQKLRELLETRLGQFAGVDRTAWNFERHRDQPDGPVGRHLLDNTYRVHGARMAMPSSSAVEVLRQLALLGFDMFRFVLRIAGGQNRRDQFDRENLWLYHYYRGPYPILWSGAMRQGMPSRDFDNFLRFTGRSALRREWNEVKRKLSPSC